MAHACSRGPDAPRHLPPSVEAELRSRPMTRRRFGPAVPIPRIALILGGIALWGLLITGLHVVVNGRGPARAAEVRPLAIGGLPVT